MNRRILVFSNVDRVLHDASARAFRTAAAALHVLTERGVPLILRSHKTRAELAHVQHELGLTHPFVCEGGAAAFVPRGYFGRDVPEGRLVAGHHAVEFGRSYTEVVDILRCTAADLRIEITAFSDMSVEEVARECQLTLLRGRLAKLREYDEPFRTLDPDPRVRARLIKALQAARLRCVRIGRFDHAGAPVDKRVALNLLRTLYRRASDRLVTIAIDDPRIDDNLLGLVDDCITLPDAERAASDLDIVNWAQTIVDAVLDLDRAGATHLVAGRRL